ncbi:MAG: ATP-binding cassette domain-containing protein [Deltaproteobacteria bacterium]|nr:MAG: ATP-binding cassette domain-containing protein [Deltaproteobacteria bacterium]
MSETTEDSDIALEVRALTRRYGSLIAVDHLDLTVHRGDIYAFLGPNGAGKTTAMRCMLGIIRRDAGTVKIFGDDHLSRARRALGAIIEIPAFHNWLSAKKNLQMACAYAGLPKDQWNAEVDRVIERVALKGRENETVRTYSLGMKQRLGIARALLGHPRLLLLDEPTNGLDPKGMREMRELIRSLALNDKITVFVSSHLLAEVQAMANRVGIIQHGKLRAEGHLDDLLRAADAAGRIRVHSPDLPKLKAAVEAIDGASFTEDEQGGFLDVASANMDSVELNRVLVTREVPVSAIAPVRSTLEDIFLEATR